MKKLWTFLAALFQDPAARPDAHAASAKAEPGQENASPLAATTGEEEAAGGEANVSPSPYNFVLTPSGEGGSFTTFQTITLTAELTRNGQPVTLDADDVAWKVTKTDVTCAAWNRGKDRFNGLTWGDVPLCPAGSFFDKIAPEGAVPTGPVARLTDIVGERTVTVEAEVILDDAICTATRTISFGAGPLSVFAGPPRGYFPWADAARACRGTPGDPGTSGYQAETKLPTRAQLKAVAGRKNGEEYGAALAAGWPDDDDYTAEYTYWTGETDGQGNAWTVTLSEGIDGVTPVDTGVPVAVSVVRDSQMTAKETTDEDRNASPSPYHLTLTSSRGGGSFPASQTVFLAAELSVNGQPARIGAEDVKWEATASEVTCAAWNRGKDRFNGLTWGDTPVSLSEPEHDMIAPAGEAPTGAVACLTDIVGERTVTVKAEVNVDGTLCTATQTISFGAGPLSVFAGTPKECFSWFHAARSCGGTPGDPDIPGYHPETRLPTRAQLKAVAGEVSGGQYGAALAAGWPDDDNADLWYTYWTGEADGEDNAWTVTLSEGAEDVLHIDEPYAVAVCVAGTEDARPTAAAQHTESRMRIKDVVVPQSASLSSCHLSLTSAGGGGSFDGFQTISLTAELTVNGQPVRLDTGNVKWEVTASEVTCAAWNRRKNRFNGLTWGETPLSLSYLESDKIAPEGVAPTGATACLTDIVGERTVTVKAEVRVNGTPCTATQTVSFGAGPLAVFAGKPRKGALRWDEAARACGGTPGNADTPGYQPETRLPTRAQLTAVSGRRNGGRYGAAHAAGWPDPAEGTGRDTFVYWTGEADGDGWAWIVNLDDGGSAKALVTINDNAIAVCVTGK